MGQTGSDTEKNRSEFLLTSETIALYSLMEEEKAPKLSDLLWGARLIGGDSESGLSISVFSF